MRLVDRIRRWFAASSLEAQLYPPPAVEVRIRPYVNADRAAVIGLHDRNAPERFPAESVEYFRGYLDSQPASFFVAETGAGELVAFGGVTKSGERVHTLCYGLVAPSYQGKGVGSTMTLARLVFATRTLGDNFSLIYAVPKSIGFYRRFGYVDGGNWQSDNGVDYPIGVLAYHSDCIGRVATKLLPRGHYVPTNLPLDQWPDYEVVTRNLGEGGYHFEVRSRADGRVLLPDEISALAKGGASEQIPKAWGKHSV